LNVTFVWFNSLSFLGKKRDNPEKKEDEGPKIGHGKE